ncbi:hypothetical protein E2C01_067093 [Portunus trituberculatus]|uniref:Uncharacterized protein n=1 Tax=Portunus trituberculatus TaxID=210409 RepID=A0A5B7HK30_PORTR|nr:hypothetical protein [Portunus trituberculatus]
MFWALDTGEDIPPPPLATPIGTIILSKETITYTRTMVRRIQTCALGDPSAPKAHVVPLYHGSPIL